MLLQIFHFASAPWLAMPLEAALAKKEAIVRTIVNLGYFEQSDLDAV